MNQPIPEGIILLYQLETKSFVEESYVSTKDWTPTFKSIQTSEFVLLKITQNLNADN